MSFVSRPFSESFDEEEDKRVRRSSKLNDLLERYSQYLDRYPMKTRCFTGAVIGAIGSMIGSRKAVRRKGLVIDWLEVFSFALHGGLVAGPLSHYINNIIDENCDSRSQVVVVDQLIAQPPQLFLLFVFIEMSRAAIASIPTALSRSTSLLGKSVVDSWRFWPISVYVLLRLLKKKKHFTGALNLCSIAWISHLAKYRSRKLGLHKAD